MIKCKIFIGIIVLSFILECSNTMIIASSEFVGEIELWKMGTSKIEELLPKEERPMKGAIVVEYFLKDNYAILHLMYEGRKIKISIIKENETDYLLKYKGKTLIGYGQELRGGAILCVYLFSNKREKNKDLPLRKKLQNRDGICKRKNTMTVEEMLKEMREQDKFAEEEQKAFEKDPPNMMKGGK